MRRRKSDIDRGWAFVILGASLIAQILILGISYSSAILYVTFLDRFHQSPSTTAWVVTLNTCCAYMFGPLGSVLYRHLDARRTVGIGCLVSTLGIIATAFAPNLVICFFSFGLTTGLGWSVAYVSLYARLVEYFQRYRKLAVATASTGIALGQFIYPPLLNFLFERYDWFGALLVLAGINLNLAVVAAVMMPPRIAQEPDVALLKSRQIARRGSRLQRVVGAATVDLPLMKNIHFLLLIGSTLVSGLAVSAFLTHITNAAIRAGHSLLQASMLASSIGIASLFGRMALGLVAQHPRVNVVATNVISFLCIGVAGLTCAFLRVYVGFLACSILFGFFSGVWGLLPEVVIAVVGLGNLTGGLGILNFFSAIGLLCGGPFAGLLFESDPSYRLSFILSGVFSILSSALLFPTICRRPVRRRSEDVGGMVMARAGQEMESLSNPPQDSPPPPP